MLLTSVQIMSSFMPRWTKIFHAQEAPAKEIQLRRRGGISST